MKSKIILAFISIILLSMSSDKSAYLIFNAQGKTVSYAEMMVELQTADLVFFGESHDNAIAHWLELEVAKSLAEAKGNDLVMGAEMYESDQQEIINEYLAGKVDYKSFKEQARLWPDHEKEYLPILNLAKEKKLSMIATNVPRRYAAMVNKGNFEVLNNLSNDAKKWIAPLPITYDSTVNCYAEMASMMAGHSKTKMYIAQAQALKDATMAYFILENFKKGQLFYHFNGSYHSDNHEGIVWYIKQAKPKLKIITITTLEKSNIAQLDSADFQQADFIISVDENITKTH
jgi:uncharacterized iron-regulated protein